ncbi:MAG: tyrosine-type recombinase/integrase [Opitutaceae bacterium]|nr:tyrosine-type recombinase/integrase [Opitutaceae bacterium]
MRTPTPRVAKYAGSETSRYVVEGLRVAGKRTRKFFPTRRAAETWLRKTLARIRKEGEGAIHMPEQLRVEAVACAERLRPYGKTLTEATDHFLAHLAAIQRSCTVTTLVAEFRASKEQDGASTRYLNDLKHRLGCFEGEFGNRIVADILPSEIDDWLRGLKAAAQTRNNFRTVLGTLFEFAMLRGYASGNPTVKIAKAKVVRGAPEIFTPEQMQTLLAKAAREFIPYLAIGAFAGLRSAELERLDWSEIDLGGRLIHVKAVKSKTAQRRLVPISDNLAAWLAPHAKQAGPVVTSLREQREKTCEAAKLSWPANGLRHSFASYRLAHGKDAAATAAELGHSSPSMLYKHYRELVRPEVAAQWWQVMPPADYGNVVAFGASAASG